jgi:hypothetical protein
MRCLRLWLTAFTLWCAGASAHGGNEVSLDPNRGAVLPSAAGDVFFQQRRQTQRLSEDQWEVTTDDIGRVDELLAKDLKRNRTGAGLMPFPSYYRQYFPARQGSDRVIVIIGFSQPASEWFPDKGIPPDQWKHDLEMVFGGGCSFWHAVYSTAKHRLLTLSGRQTIVCNAPK